MTQVSAPVDTGTTETGDGAAAQAQEKAQEVAGQAKEQAQQAAGEAKSRVREQVDQRSTEAGEQVSSTAGDLRSVGEELRKQGKDTPARLADQAADRADRLGGYLKDSDADRILHDVEDFARRQPWAVAAGGLALGFAASRFLKASSSQRYQASRAETTQPSGGPERPVPAPARPVPATERPVPAPPYAPPAPPVPPAPGA